MRGRASIGTQSWDYRVYFETGAGRENKGGSCESVKEELCLLGRGGEGTLKAGSVFRWHVRVWKQLRGDRSSEREIKRNGKPREGVCVGGIIQGG